MPIDGWEPDADTIDFDDNPKKDGSADLYGEEVSTEQSSSEQPEQPVEATDEDNALTAVIDIGLDMVENISKDMGYPQPNRSIWENHGKSAMNKAVNTLCPAGTGGGTVINSPWVGLIIGLGCLFMCLYPLISYKLKQKDSGKGKVSSTETKQVQTAEEKPLEKPMDNAAPPIPAKLPGGGDEAMPTVPMSELIRRNLESGGEPTPI